MSSISQVHVVDSDSRRRAQIARRLAASSIRTEIYESMEELANFCPTSGFILINRDLGENPFESQINRMFEQGQYLPFAVYSSAPSPSEVVDSMLSGALDYLVWPFGAGEIESALAKISERSVRTAELERKRFQARALTASLSKREREVLALMIGGSSNKDMGQALGISWRTVEIHRANVLKKLAANSTADAVRIGIYADLDLEAG